jgi:hypothetical protein
MQNEAALHIRLPAAVREELEKAAKADDRPVTALARRILTDWLRLRAQRKQTEKRT